MDNAYSSGRSSPKRQSASAMVLDQLRQELLKGMLPAGCPLRQDEIAAKFGVSRIPVREALSRLVSEGLARFEPNRGFFVRGFSPSEAAEILELRAILEREAVRLAVPALTEQNLAEARGILEEAEDTDDIERWSELNWQFHAALYSPAGRARLSEEIRRFSDQTDPYIRLLIANASYREKAEQEHRLILNVASSGAADATALLIEKHITSTGIILSSFLSEQQANGTGPT